MYCYYRCDWAESNVGGCWRQEISREWSFPQAQRCCERSRDLCFSSTAASQQKAKTQVGQAFFFSSFHLSVLLLDWTWKCKNPEVSLPTNVFWCLLPSVLWLKREVQWHKGSKKCTWLEWVKYTVLSWLVYWNVKSFGEVVCLVVDWVFLWMGGRVVLKER